MAPIQEFSNAIGAAADAVGPAVVGLGRGWGHGSGAVVGDGRVLTNAHNLRRDEPTVVFADDRREAAGGLAAASPARSSTLRRCRAARPVARSSISMAACSE